MRKTRDNRLETTNPEGDTETNKDGQDGQEVLGRYGEYEYEYEYE